VRACIGLSRADRHWQFGHKNNISFSRSFSRKGNSVTKIIFYFLALFHEKERKGKERRGKERKKETQFINFMK
jgi:hypothetical protein